MILLFTKSIPNKTYQLNIDVGSPNDIGRPSNETAFVANPPQFPSWSPTQTLPPSCSYPLNINELFPYWLRQASTNTNANLISLTQNYYQWLTCYSADINSVGFFDLESINDVETMPDKYVPYFSDVYLNSIPSNQINYPGYSSGNVDQIKIRSLVENVKTNLYSRKGTKSSYELVINKLYDIPPENISITNPKQYIMRLNSGRFDWMQDNVTNPSDSQSTFEPSLTSSYLNISVLPDTNLWQDYSYVVNVSGLSLAAYDGVIRPLLHPAGTLDFFQLTQNVFNNTTEVITTTTDEIPVITNYVGYTFGSTTTLARCVLGPGSDPTFVFPTWDKEISKYSPGVSFGGINIGDFLLLTPLTGFTHPNDARAALGVCL